VMDISFFDAHSVIILLILKTLFRGWAKYRGF